MKRILIPSLLVTLTFGLTSCSNEENSQTVSSEYITVSTEINALTRVATDATTGTQSFENGDQISVYAWTGDATKAPQVSDRVVDNAINTLDGNTWTAAPQMLWKNTIDDHYFIGVYPKNATSVTDLTAADYTFDVTDQETSDLLVAVNVKGLKSDTNPVPLQFNHVMAMLKVSLQFRNQWGGTPTVESVTVKDAAAAATVNYLTQKVTASTTAKADIVLPETEANTQYASILIPQTGVKSIVIKIGGKDYTYTNTDADGIKFEEGKTTNVGLIVGRNEITLGTVSIDDWQDGSSITDGEAQE